MYSLLHCLSLIMLLRQASNAHVTPEENTSEALRVGRGGGAAKQHNKSGTHSATEPAGAWRHRPLVMMPLGDLHHPEALQFGGSKGHARPANVGPFSQNILPGKRGGGRKMDVRPYI